MHHLLILLDCVTRTKRWIEVSTESLAADEGMHSLGEWLLDAVSYITEARINAGLEESCIHLLTKSFTQEEMDEFLVEELTGGYGSNSTH
jgi:hypothetical protein